MQKVKIKKVRSYADIDKHKKRLRIQIQNSEIQINCNLNKIKNAFTFNSILDVLTNNFASNISDYIRLFYKGFKSMSNEQ